MIVDQNTMKMRLMTKIAWGLCLIILAILMVWAKAFHSSKAAYLQGLAFTKTGDHIRAITFFDRSIRWYTPFNPYVFQSAEQLWDIGERAEKQNDVRAALIAYRTILQGFYGASSFYTPGQHWILKCEKKIEELTGTRRDRSSRLDGGEKPGGSPIFEAIAQNIPGPHRGWSFLVVTAFLGWVGSVFGFILFGLAANGRTIIRWSRAAGWCVSAAVFFIVWIISMMKA
jgi:hypothetical protein